MSNGLLFSACGHFPIVNCDFNFGLAVPTPQTYGAFHVVGLAEQGGRIATFFAFGTEKIH